jgi:hypothetical protein
MRVFTAIQVLATPAAALSSALAITQPSPSKYRFSPATEPPL